MKRIYNITTLVEGDAVGTLRVLWDMEYYFARDRHYHMVRHDEVLQIYGLHFVLFDRVSFDLKYMLQDAAIRSHVESLVLEHVSGLEVFEIGGLDFKKILKK